jgi:hypothetical protein
LLTSKNWKKRKTRLVEPQSKIAVGCLWNNNKFVKYVNIVKVAKIFKIIDIVKIIKIVRILECSKDFIVEITKSENKKIGKNYVKKCWNLNEKK